MSDEKPKLGSDPELFIWDKVNKKFKSSIGLIGGSKLDPLPMNPGYFVQEDNVLVEFNIPPASSKIEFIENILSGKAQVEKLLGDNFELKVQSSAFMPMEELDHPLANEFGCTPDNNAWNNGDYNDAPLAPMNGLRSAGGHIHVGFIPNEKLLKRLKVDRAAFNIEVVKLCDLYLGIPSVVMDKDTERRKLYGKAGAFRHKPYGLEYRVLSPFWLERKEKIAWAYDQTMRALERALDNAFLTSQEGENIQYAINQQAVPYSMELVDKYGLAVVD